MLMVISYIILLSVIITEQYKICEFLGCFLTVLHFFLVSYDLSSEINFVLHIRGLNTLTVINVCLEDHVFNYLEIVAWLFKHFFWKLFFPTSEIKHFSLFIFTGYKTLKGFLLLQSFVSREHVSFIFRNLYWDIVPCMRFLFSKNNS